MPLIINQNGYRIFFYSNEGHEPIHVHVEKSGALAKYWIKPVKLAKNEGYKIKELRIITKIIFEHQSIIEEKWNEYFN